LQEKGLLEAAPGRGLAVAVLDMQRIFELYALRIELESVVARFAARHATEAELANLEQINRQFGASGEPAEAARLNRAFHARLYDAARNRYLQAAVEELHDTIALLPETTFLREGRTAEAAVEHAAIIEAIRRQDVEAAWKAGRDHISAALQARLALLQRS
jgi:DNA-binding GntR family transcriptional regulator